MSNNEIAFFVGLFGSVHCIGMCGPLAFAIPVTSAGFWLLVWDKLVYNLGRVVSYSLLGLVTGLLGRQFWLFGLQQYISIFSGILIILAALARLVRYPLTRGRMMSVLLSPFNKLISYALKNKAGHFIIGILNGFLPCGFVYLALLGSVNTGTLSGGVQYMFYFGIGTIPLMLAATIGAGSLNLKVRKRLNAIVPYFMLLLGIWFILRGLSLDIPYLSPQAQVGGVNVCH
ncbi:MAG: sulfite exporter TauE/SafE family protein [Mucilaginibacter sp.]|uniref:sulfite exporter TauE/SafE family protein n=1 Tax=Mucilaginibacter sp. TaxID=1882438 RepID=UPI00326768A8